MNPILILNPDNLTEESAIALKRREAARGVVFDENNKVALLPVTAHNYYKLPGGGIEEGEGRIEAFRRECLEEIGSDVEVIQELGSVVEYRTKFSLVQTSYCFVGKTIGVRKKTALTQHEIEQGFTQAVWVSIDEALTLVSSSNPSGYEGRFIKERDTYILQTVKSHCLYRLNILC